MKEMEAAIKFQNNTAFVKNLFYVDKKSQFYLILAESNTKVGKQFWKALGLASGNMRMSKPEHLEEVLNSKQGHLNPFSLVNDKADKVKKVILDNKLKSFEYWGLHPLENDATIEIR